MRPSRTCSRCSPGIRRSSGPSRRRYASADLGLNPSNDGKIVRVPVPPLTEERRQQLAKQVHEAAEEHRTAIRNVRRDSNDRLKRMLKDKQISEDAERDALAEVQKITDTYIGKIEELAKSKEQELLTSDLREVKSKATKTRQTVNRDKKEASLSLASRFTPFPVYGF